MRFINGVIVGFLLAIGVAYWHDRTVANGPDAATRELVNWDEFGRSFSAVTGWVQDQVSTLTDQLHRSR